MIYKSNWVLKAIKGIYNSKTFTEKQIKKYLE